MSKTTFNQDGGTTSNITEIGISSPSLLLPADPQKTLRPRLTKSGSTFTGNRFTKGFLWRELFLVLCSLFGFRPLPSGFDSKSLIKQRGRCGFKSTPGLPLLRASPVKTLKNRRCLSKEPLQTSYWSPLKFQKLL